MKTVKYWTSLLKSKQPKCKSFDIVSKAVNDFLTPLKVSFFSYMASLFHLNEKSSSKSSKQFHLGLATKAILKEPKSKDMISRNDFQKFYVMVSKSVKTAAFKLFNKSPLNLVTMYTSRIFNPTFIHTENKLSLMKIVKSLTQQLHMLGIIIVNINDNAYEQYEDFIRSSFDSISYKDGDLLDDLFSKR